MSRAAVLLAQADALEAAAAVLRAEAAADGEATAERMLSASEAADRLGLHVNTVWKMLADGTLQGFKIRGVWRVPPSAIARAMIRSVS